MENLQIKAAHTAEKYFSDIITQNFYIGISDAAAIWCIDHKNARLFYWKDSENPKNDGCGIEYRGAEHFFNNFSDLDNFIKNEYMEA